MTDEEDDDYDYERFVHLMNKSNGYSGIFNYNNIVDKRLVEKSTIEEWCRSIKAELGIEVGVPQPIDEDPPDFNVSINGQLFSVELVQLVDENHKKRAVKGESQFAGKLFNDTQWSVERLLSKLNAIIHKKGDKYSRDGLSVDVLLMHTDEPWLTSEQARTWLNNATINTHPSIHRVFLMFTYEPGRDVEHWPILKIYGELTL
jgi:hypothetical protein